MTRTLAVRIDQSLLEAVDAALEQEGRSRSEAVREALQLWLQRRVLAEKVNRHRQGYQRRPISKDELAPVLEAQTWPK